MVLGCVTDEISMDPEYAVKTGIQEGVYSYEIRNIMGCRVPFCPDGHRGILKKILREYEVEYTAISPGLFKDMPHDIPFMKTYDRILRFASLMGIRRIIVFAGRCGIGEKYYNHMLENIYNFTKMAQKEGLTVCLENSANTCCCTGKEVADIIKALNLSNLKANWDPGNAAVKGHMDYEQGYGCLKGYVDNVHIKDVQRDEDGKHFYVPVGEGLVDYKNQLKDLRDDGYNGYITIETHCKPSEIAFRKSARYLKRVFKKLRISP